MFWDVSQGGPGSEGCFDQCRVLVNRQEDDLGTAPAGSGPAGRLDSADDWHRDIDYENIGLEPLRGLEQGLPVADFSHHVEFGL